MLKMWAELITGIPGVENHPNHPTYEIKPTVSNALRGFEYLHSRYNCRSERLDVLLSKG